MTHTLTHNQNQTALLRNTCSINAQKTNSLCCAAAGIAPLCGSNTEVLVPHEKLREAATIDTTLIAQMRPPAQPVVGYKHPRQQRGPALPPPLPKGSGLPRYSLLWNGPQQPVAVPMDDGYWTPWHLTVQIGGSHG